VSSVSLWTVLENPSKFLQFICTHIKDTFISLGNRYKKLARDVPQSLWMITSTSSDQNECDEGDGKHKNSLDTNELAEVRPTHQRKGRNSVEEIVSFAVKQVSGCSECRLHACGREDIDVRCIGNVPNFLSADDRMSEISITAIFMCCTYFQM